MSEIKTLIDKAKDLQRASSDFLATYGIQEKELARFRSNRNEEENMIEKIKAEKSALEKAIAILIEQRKSLEDENRKYQEKEASFAKQLRADAEKIMREAKEDNLEIISKREKLNRDIEDFSKEKAAFDAREKKIAELRGAR